MILRSSQMRRKINIRKLLFMMMEQSTTKPVNEMPAFDCQQSFGLGVFYSNKKFVGALALLLCGTLAALAGGSGTDNRAPEVPAEIAVQDGNKVHFHGFGIGVQIYTWDGFSWGVPVPDATLYDSDGNVVATHFAGPTWKSNSGSSVVGLVVPPRITVDTNAIPWLLLSAVNPEGPGIFANTTFIQRVNTSGGKAPAANGTVIGQVASVPYSADYYFYRKSHN